MVPELLGVSSASKLFACDIFVVIGGLTVEGDSVLYVLRITSEQFACQLIKLTIDSLQNSIIVFVRDENVYASLPYSDVSSLPLCVLGRMESSTAYVQIYDKL